MMAKEKKRCQEPLLTQREAFCRIRGMGRALRIAAGGFAYHVLNRANARMRIFDKPKDYEAFERILADAVRRVKMRLLAYCVMPNHWHLVVWPREEGDLSTFVGWLTLTHTQRWHAHRHSVGSGHVYQGRFKSFLVESDEYLWTVCRYVERNALRAGLCERAEEWRWSSLWRREFGDAECQNGAVEVAHRRAEGLGKPRESGGKPTRVGGVAALRESWAAIRKRGLGGADDKTVWPRFGVPPPRPSPQGIRTKRFLTPFSAQAIRNGSLGTVFVTRPSRSTAATAICGNTASNACTATSDCVPSAKGRTRFNV